MHRHAKRLPYLWLLLTYLLIIVSCLSVFFLPAPVVCCLLALLAVIQTLCLILVKKTISKIEQSSAEELNKLEVSYQKKLYTLNERLKKTGNAYKQILVQYKKIKTYLLRVSEEGSSTQTPESAYMLPFTQAEEKTENLYTIAAETIRELEPFSKAHQVRIQLVSTQKELFFTCSYEYIRILFRNIIDNSLKYMCRPGNLVITLSQIGEDIFIIFKDDGAGLPESELRYIFELNYQGSNRSSGNGLGLAQAKAIIDFYHGTVFAKSRPGNGMTIYIQLPQ